MADRNYDHVPLLKKLGVKDGLSLLAVGFDDLDFLEGRPCAQSYSQDDIFDLIFLRSETMSGLDLFEELIPHLAPNGAIWTVTPKGVKSISGEDVILRGRAAGLNDAKVCAFSGTHTGRKFVRWK
jgi:hypothetical protein